MAAPAITPTSKKTRRRQRRVFTQPIFPSSLSPHTEDLAAVAAQRAAAGVDDLAVALQLVLVAEEYDLGARFPRYLLVHEGYVGDEGAVDEAVDERRSVRALAAPSSFATGWSTETSGCRRHAMRRR